MKLAYSDVGTGEPALVLVHGWSCDRTYLAPQAEHFSARHRVVSLDLRGHGESAAPYSTYSIADFAEDVVQLCRDLRLSRPVLVGHSMGGCIVLHVALQWPDVPGAIVVLDSPTTAPPLEQQALVREVAMRTRAGDDSARLSLIDNMMFHPVDDLDRRAEITTAMMRTPRHVAAAAMEGVMDWTRGAGEWTIAVPALAVASARLPPGWEQFATRGPRVLTAQTAGSGHFHQLEVPEQVNAMIERFLWMLSRPPWSSF